MSKRHIYRVGDRVRVLEDKFIKRIGYPLVWTDLIEEVEQDPKVLEAAKILGMVPANATLPEKRAKADGPWDLLGELRMKVDIPLDLVRVVARRLVEQRNFGGNQRTIHYSPPGGMVGASLQVLDKRMAKTGVRFGERGGYDSYSGEYDYEPAYLADCKTHVILLTNAGEIEDCHVEPE